MSNQNTEGASILQDLCSAKKNLQIGNVCLDVYPATFSFHTVLADFAAAFGRLPSANDTLQGLPIGQWFDDQMLVVRTIEDHADESEVAIVNGFHPDRQGETLTYDDAKVYLHDNEGYISRFSRYNPAMWDKLLEFVAEHGTVPQYSHDEDEALAEWFEGQMYLATCLTASYFDDITDNLEEDMDDDEIDCEEASDGAFRIYLNEKMFPKMVSSWDKTTHTLLEQYVAEHAALPTKDVIYHGEPLGMWLSDQIDVAKEAENNAKQMQLMYKALLSYIWEEQQNAPYDDVPKKTVRMIIRDRANQYEAQFEPSCEELTGLAVEDSFEEIDLFDGD